MLIEDLLYKINKSKRPALVRFLRERNWSDTRIELIAGNPSTPREDHGVIMLLVICMMQPAKNGTPGASMIRCRTGRK